MKRADSQYYVTKKVRKPITKKKYVHEVIKVRLVLRSVPGKNFVEFCGLLNVLEKILHHAMVWSC